jgi:hypothetical protein
MLPQPPAGEAYLTKLVSVLNANFLVREPEVLGFRQDTTKIYVRYRAPFAVGWIQVHVQSTQPGEGGTTAYDASNYTSTTEVDCRLDRIQDVSVTFVASSTYVVFLIPVQYDANGNKVLYDGTGGVDDRMSYAGFVV